MDNSIFVPTHDYPAGASEHTPETSSPEFRWNGVSTTGEKTPEAGQRARQTAFATIEEFEKWRRSKGMPELTFCALAWAFARFKGENPGETAVANPVLERR